MHPSALNYGKLFFDLYCSDLSNVTVVDIGAQNVNGSLKDVCPESIKYIGVDFVVGNGVDIVLDDPYKLPFEDDSLDIVVCSSCLEHSQFFWLLFLEIVRTLKSDGLIYLNAPSNGSFHRYPVDCWRFYPDSGHALVAWANKEGYPLALLESFIGDQSKSNIKDGAAWHDFVAIFVKSTEIEHKYKNRIVDTLNNYSNGCSSIHGSTLKEVVLSPDHLKIVDLAQALDERDGQIARLKQEITERDDQIANLNLAIAERDEIKFIGTYQPDSVLRALQVQRAQHRFTASIIIPVFNKVEYTQQCIHAIIRNTPAQLFEIIIIDNASTDDTKSYLQGLSGDVRIITNDQNVGYTIACNQGATVAQGKYLVLLNNDTVPQPGWLESLIKLAEERPDAGAIGAKLVYPNGMLQEAGGIVFQDGSGWNFGNGDDANKPVYNVVSDVDYCSGACLLVKKELFDQIGGFDEQYAPAYYEETDLCFSLRRKGYKTLYNPDTLVVHHESVTAGLDLKSSFRKYIEINKVKFRNKWFNELEKHEIHPSISGVSPFTADRSRLDK